MAVSLRLFTSRVGELATRLDTFLREVPAALRAAVAAVEAFAEVHRPAAAAAAVAAVAHQRAAEAQVRLLGCTELCTEKGAGLAATKLSNSKRSVCIEPAETLEGSCADSQPVFCMCRRC